MYEQEEQDHGKELEERLARLSAFAGKLTQKRKQAIDGRAKSGIEILWQQDDEYYDGIDDANRHEEYFKGATSESRLISRSSATKQTNRSTVFENITAPYVDMGAARVADMLLPTDDMPFAIKPTPIPEVTEVLDSEEPMPGGEATVGDAAKLFLAEMDEKAELAETQIWDWLVESGWHSEMRKVIEQSARIGTGCLKGPFVTKRKKRKMVKGEDGIISLEILEEIKPASKMIDVWNLYPDPSCGTSIHNGSYVFERDMLSAKQLRDLIGTNYLDAEILKVLEEGPGKRNIDGKGKTVETDSFELWSYHGLASKEDLSAAGCQCKEGESFPVVVEMVNDRVIKATLSILPSGEFPYDVMLWQRRTDTWAGKGIARQVRTSQRKLNAAWRNLLDNAGISSGPQIIMRDGVVVPADGVNEITPMKIWYVDEDANINDVRSAFTSIIIPSLQAELEQIIQMSHDSAERATSMPLLLQGQQGAATETVGGMTMLQNNSSTVLRRIAKICDDDITVPHVGRYYEWLMLYSDNDKAKGDFSIVAQGSSALFERDAQNQMIMQMIPMAANPEFGLNPDKLMIEVLKMNKITPERVCYTEEEKAQMKKAAQENPPQDVALQVAQLRAEGDLKKVQIANESDKEELALKRQEMESSYALKLQMQKSDHDNAMELKQIELKMKMLELAQSQQVSLDSIKAALADTALRLKTEVALSERDKGHEIDMKAYEPKGVAPDGQAYNQ